MTWLCLKFYQSLWSWKWILEQKGLIYRGLNDITGKETSFPTKNVNAIDILSFDCGLVLILLEIF